MLCARLCSYTRRAILQPYIIFYGSHTHTGPSDNPERVRPQARQRTVNKESDIDVLGSRSLIRLPRLRTSRETACAEPCTLIRSFDSCLLVHTGPGVADRARLPAAQWTSRLNTRCTFSHSRYTHSLHDWDWYWETHWTLELRRTWRLSW
jgi:hypothetical protein